MRLAKKLHRLQDAEKQKTETVRCHSAIQTKDSAAQEKNKKLISNYIGVR